MKDSPEYLNFALDKLSPIDYITSRAMFSEYGVFHEGLVFALISDDTLDFKANESNREMYKRAQSEPFRHGVSYWEVPSDVLEDNGKLYEWARISIGIAQEAARKKRK